MAGLTPMKRQYNEIKERHEDCLLFFRLGDFYEMFDDDAVLASRELDLTLTTRDKNVEDPDERTPMCGVPYHSAEAYIARLIAKGYKVAICEQTEDPATAKGLVSRDVIRVITPGTVTDASMLEEGRSTYVASIFTDMSGGGICFADVSTGEFCAAFFTENSAKHIINELGRFCPAEVILSEGAAGNGEITTFLRDSLDCLTTDAAERFDYEAGARRLASQFGVSGAGELGLADKPGLVFAAGALLSYIEDTQKTELGHIKRFDLFTSGQYMEMDYTTRRSLELTETLRTGEKRGSLLWVLDKTGTPMGSRLLRSWVERPLLSPVAIKRRHASVDELFRESVLRSELTVQLREIGDLERIIGKAVYGTANGRDLLALARSCEPLPAIREMLAPCSSGLLAELAGMDALVDISGRILRAVCDEPPFSVREGGILRTGYSEEVDRLRALRDNGAEMISALEARERERTGIRKLKVGYNRVFGYYIDIPRSQDGLVPEGYIRKQTLVSNERYFTEELKELENTILTARDRVSELEFNLFSELRDRVAAEVERVKRTSESVAVLDVLRSLAETAARNGYAMPEIDATRTIDIKDGRHPVVELTQKDTLFVPNDAHLNGTTNRVAIITGPNMAGKSTYMRQTALIVLMAQMGGFVPAKYANIGIVDRVFTRIGASDDLAAGQSTFMVEMTEMAAILREATASSLLILDEIGRGTSTYDGMAIAQAILEHCADGKKLGAKTMFATHYHELTDLENSIPGVRNYNITAKKQGSGLVFLRKIVPGAADDSYGIEVAKLAGVPESVIRRAKQRLEALESGAERKAPDSGAREEAQVSLTDVSSADIARRLRSLDLDTLTPIEAMNLLFEFKREVGG